MSQEEIFKIVAGICVGIGLSSSCGFRVFVPMLAMSIANKAGWLEMSEGFAWVGTWPAIIALSVATALEIGAYYVPWLDNMLDTVTTPSAVIAGSVTAAACFTDIDPFLKWSLAIIAGGGSAAVIKAGASGVRALSLMTTGGAANPIVSTVELVASIAMSVISIAFIFAGAVLAVIIVGFSLKYALRFVLRKKPSAEVEAKPA